MLEPGSIGYWIGSVILAVLLVGGTYAWVRSVIQVGRRVRQQLERRYRIDIERERGVWQITEESWRTYRGSRPWLLVVVTTAWVAFRIGPIFIWLVLLAAFWFAAAVLLGP